MKYGFITVLFTVGCMQAYDPYNIASTNCLVKETLNQNLEDVIQSENIHAYLQCLYNQGFDVYQTDSEGWNALHWSVWLGHLPLVEYLIEDLEFDVKKKTGIKTLH